MPILYSIGLKLYGLGIRVGSIFSSKAAKWVAGRKGLIRELKFELPRDKRWVWFHAASLGEFEQGRPLIEKIRHENPEYYILLTFFSPSGYEIRKNYDQVDKVCYMPLDTRSNARAFVAAVDPALAVFIKYEIWYHHLDQLEQRNIPILLISAQFRKGQIYFRKYGQFFEPIIRKIHRIFVADQGSDTLLKEHDFHNSEFAGDTRIDRVIATSQAHRDFAYMRDVLETDQIMVAGSSWPGDENIVIPYLNKGQFKGIIAPHEIDESHLLKIEAALTVRHCRMSALHPGSKADVIIVDTIGDLAHIYHLAKIAYVGGGFGKGIHNILEAAVYRVPVIFGPNYHQFSEARELIELGAASSISTGEEFERAISNLTQVETCEKISSDLEEFFKRHEGATAHIYNYICRERLL